MEMRLSAREVEASLSSFEISEGSREVTDSERVEIESARDCLDSSLRTRLMSSTSTENVEDSESGHET